MKTNFLILSLLSLFLISGCQKKELASPDQGRVINLKLTGVSTEILEFIYKDSVVATTNASDFSITTLLAVDGEAAKLNIRKKGTSDILQSKEITEAPFNQSINIFYDGTKIYENVVTLLLTGYAMSGEVEFLIDGNLAGEGSVKIDKTLTLYMDNEQTRTLTIRKKGETTALLTKTINAKPASGQSVTFLFDGISIVENVQLDPPVNPQNMMIKARFQTNFANQFKNVDVDLVFYTRLASDANTVVGTKVVPELRFKLAKDGSFNTLELPPLPGPNYIYSFDIVESGTNVYPYIYTTPLVLTGYTVKPNEGRITTAFASEGLKFQSGKSKLLVITDGRLSVTNPSKMIYICGGKVTDLSEYFK